MVQFELKTYTPEEYETDMKKLLIEKGLYEAVKEYCDEINHYACKLDYLSCRIIQENLCTILDLIRFEREIKQ